MLADQLYAWPLGRPNFAQLPQERTSPELIEFLAKRFVHRDTVPAPHVICHPIAPGFRVAHASRVLAMMSRHRGLSLPVRNRWLLMKYDESLFRRDAETNTRDACATRNTQRRCTVISGERRLATCAAQTREFYAMRTL